MLLSQIIYNSKLYIYSSLFCRFPITHHTKRAVHPVVTPAEPFCTEELGMSVKRVDVFPLKYQEPNDDNADRYIVLVRLETDSGLVGWGECISQFRPST